MPQSAVVITGGINSALGRLVRSGCAVQRIMVGTLDKVEKHKQYVAASRIVQRVHVCWQRRRSRNMGRKVQI